MVKSAYNPLKKLYSGVISPYLYRFWVRFARTKHHFLPSDRFFCQPHEPICRKKHWIPVFWGKKKPNACPWTSQKSSCGIPVVLGISLGPKHLLSRAVGGGFEHRMFQHPLKVETVVGSSRWGFSLEKKIYTTFLGFFSQEKQLGLVRLHEEHD